MSMSVPVASMRIANELKEAEVALDRALLTQSRLLSEMLSARLAVNGEAFIGQAEVMRLLKAQQSVTASTNDLARVHGGLLQIGREKSYIDECPKDGRTNGLSDAA